MLTNFELKGLKGTLLLKLGEIAAYKRSLALIFDQSGVALNPLAPLVVLSQAMCLPISSSNGCKEPIAYSRIIFLCDVS